MITLILLAWLALSIFFGMRLGRFLRDADSTISPEPFTGPTGGPSGLPFSFRVHQRAIPPINGEVHEEITGGVSLINGA